MYFDPDLGSDIVLQFVVATAQIRTASRTTVLVRAISCHLNELYIQYVPIRT